VVIDLDGRLLYANPACESMLGTSSAEIVGREICASTTLHEEGGARGATRRGHAEIELPNGERRWVAYSANACELPDGGGPAFVAFVRDETERRRDELRLSHQNDLLEQTLRGLAHDLRSPLVSVLGFSRLLREEFGAGLGERGAHFLDRIHAAGRTMEQLIRDLLEYARIGHDGERIACVDPREVLQQLHAELKPRLEQDGVELVLPASPPLVRCDRTRLYQVFSNLIGNALDHMGPCESPRIEVCVLDSGTQHEIVVRDNGRGVAPEQAERIFEMFHSAPRPGGRKGTGVGLAIVRKIAELHGGRATVASTPGGGAVFRVTLARD
jgi:PAS domain S-box-containing protein